jgi:hypothetical protein
MKIHFPPLLKGRAVVFAGDVKLVAGHECFGGQQRDAVRFHCAPPVHLGKSRLSRKKKNRDNWVAEGFVALLKELRRIRALRFFKKRDKICQSIFWPGRIT